MSTLQTTRDLYYSILKEQQDSSAYPLVLADSLINTAQRNICSGNIVDLTNTRRDEIQKGPLPFLYADVYYESVQDTFVWITIDITDTEITVSSTSGFSTSGVLFINGDIISYTGLTFTQFTGVTGIGFPHKGGARVSQLLDLPTDYTTSNRLIYNYTRTLPYKDYRDIFLDLNQYKGRVNDLSNDYDFNKGIRPFYTIIQGKYLLPYQVDKSGDMIHLIYEKKPATLVAGVDELLIPEEYADSTVAFIAASKTLYNRGEEDRGLKLFNFAISEVIGMYSYYKNQNSESLHGQRIGNGKDNYYNI